MTRRQRNSNLKIRIIIGKKSGFKDKQDLLVGLRDDGHIKEFEQVLSTQGKKKAMLFALSKGEILDPADDSPQLILTEESAHWDLMV